MLEVEQFAQKLLQVGPGFQKAGREGEGGRGREREKRGGEGRWKGRERERQRRERVQAGKPELKSIHEERRREKF